MSSDETQWLTYKQAADKLGVSPQAVRQKAIRGRWHRTKGNDGHARVQVPDQPYSVRTVFRQASDGALLDALREHIATLKIDIERLTAELAGERAELAAERTRADGATAELKGNIARLEGDLSIERVTRRADQKQHHDQLAAERAGRQADQEQYAAARQADQDQHQNELAAERTARQADCEQHQEQLAAEQAGRQADQQHAAARQVDQEQQLAMARAAADRATAELVELARRLAQIAENQTTAEATEAEPEPPRRSAAGRAWRWFLRN
jgi:hypothetical protein